MGLGSDHLAAAGVACRNLDHRAWAAVLASSADQCDGYRPNTRNHSVPGEEFGRSSALEPLVRIGGYRDHCNRRSWFDDVKRSHGIPGAFRGLTFELSCGRRQDDLAAQQKMSEVSAAARPRRPAGARQLERLVSPTPCHASQAGTVHRSRSRDHSATPELEPGVTLMWRAEHGGLKRCTGRVA